MNTVLDRIAAWEASGLIDAATAARLRAAEAAMPDESSAAAAAAGAGQQVETARRGPSPLAAIFGPVVSIGEMFAYLGGAFLLGAYGAFVARIASNMPEPELVIAAGAALAAIAIAVVALQLRRGDARRRRAAGVFFAVAVGSAFLSGVGLGNAMGLRSELVSVIASLVATGAALAFRWIQPALLTQATLLAAVTGLATASLGWFRSLIDPGPQFTEFGETILTARPDPLVLVVVSALWWLGVGLVLGIWALREAGADADDPASGRRAALTRLWAGLTAVAGLTVAVTRSDYRGTNEFGRVLEPWIGDLAILALAAVLVERAFRRDANAFVYAAALAVMIALSDFNFSYLSTSTEVGLLIEGLILLGAGFAADRLRRRVGHSEPTDEPTMAPGASA